MTTETFASLNINKIYRSGNSDPEWACPAEALGPGDTCRIGSDGKLYATSQSDGDCAGIVETMDGHNIDTDYTVGTDLIVPYYPKGNGTEVYAKCILASPVVACAPGRPAILSGTDDLIAPFVYTASSYEYLSSLGMLVGHFTEYDAGSTTVNQVVSIFI